MTLCFIDTETTGVHPDREMWEIAMIRDDTAGYCNLFVEVDLSKADPFGLNVGRFYERHPLGRYLAGEIPRPEQQGPEEAELVSQVEAAKAVATWTHGCHLVGAVPDFDARTLDPLLRKFGLIPSWHYHLIDVEAMAMGYLHGLHHYKPDVPADLSLPWKSDELSRACGVEPPTENERHSALGDARWAQRWYVAITGGAS